MKKYFLLTSFVLLCLAVVPAGQAVAQQKKIEVKEKQRKIDDDKIKDNQEWRKEKAKRIKADMKTAQKKSDPDRHIKKSKIKAKDGKQIDYQRTAGSPPEEATERRRSFEARSQRIRDIEAAEKELMASEKSLYESQMKLKQARIKLAEDQKSGKFKSENEVRSKKRRLDEAEKRLEVLERRLRKQRNTLNRMKKEIQQEK